MSTGPQVLGAEGEVKVAEGPNGNTLVKIAIKHLADPGKVSAGATVYVAWIQSSEGGTLQNVGPTATAPSSNPVLTTKIAAKT